MRIKFYDDELKDKLDQLAIDLEMSLNQIVNLILSAQFSDKERKSLSLLMDLQEIKNMERLTL